MSERPRNPMLWAALIAICFVVAAGVGGFLTARHIDDTAVASGSSTNAKDVNGIQEQQKKPSARAIPPTTTGSNVPPASR